MENNGYERLTKKYPGGYGLVKVRDDEQAVDSPYKNTLLAVQEAMQRLGAYEDSGLSPEQTAAPAEINGDTSDGYHTFNELYHHRAVLFSVIVAQHPEKCWKSKKHHDGTMYDGMFIVGIDTPSGQASYHYDVSPYWDMFSCTELDNAPEWDGHTPDQAIGRIGLLGMQQ